MRGFAFNIRSIRSLTCIIILRGLFLISLKLIGRLDMHIKHFAQGSTCSAVCEKKKEVTKLLKEINYKINRTTNNIIINNKTEIALPRFAETMK